MPNVVATLFPRVSNSIMQERESIEHLSVPSMQEPLKDGPRCSWAVEEGGVKSAANTFWLVASYEAREVHQCLQ